MTDLASALPSDQPAFWAHIANELAQAIGQGVYAPGSRLPSEHSLAARFGVNRHTVRRSLADLVQRGLVRAEQGSGTYVEDFAVDLAIGRRTRHRQNLLQAGLRGGLQVVHAERVRASVAQAQALQVPARSAVLRLQVLGQGDGQPLHFSDRYFPLPRFANLANLVRETGSISAGFAAHGVHDYVRQESRISARMPDAGTAAHLRQAATRPALLVTSVNVDPQGIPIEFAEAWFAGDRVTLTVRHDES
jgi:GntR family phosphonate transport system transcriptional regulator